MKLKVTPRFDVKEIMLDTIGADWFIFQNQAFLMGKRLQVYMQKYINSNRKRRGGTGTLAKAINFRGFNAPGLVSWGIGYRPRLPKYWYVINYGKMLNNIPFIPYKGAIKLGSFEGSKSEPAFGAEGGVERFRPSDGSGFGVRAKRPVRPMNYISATWARFNIEFMGVLAGVKAGISIGRGAK